MVMSNLLFLLSSILTVLFFWGIALNIRLYLVRRKIVTFRGDHAPKQQDRLSSKDALEALLLVFLGELLLKSTLQHFNIASQRFIILLNIPFQLFMLSVVLFIFYRKGIHIKEVGVKKEFLSRVLKRGLYFYMLLFPLFAASGIISSFVCEKLHLPPQSQIIEILLKETNLLNISLLALQAIILAPLIEELLFRGLIYNSLKKNGIKQAMILSSVIFSLFHREPFALLPVFVLGLYLSFIYERYKNLFYPVFLHSLHNSFIFVLVLSLKSTIHKIPHIP